MFRWFGWEVAFPLMLPPIIGLVVIGLFQTGPQPLDIDWGKILDFAPWTLCFFALTLVGSSLRRTQERHSQRRVVFWSLILVAGVTSMYLSLLIIWRQAQSWQPNGQVWIASSLLCFIATGLCYALERK